MLDFKTMKTLNQSNIKNVQVYSDGIFQLEYDMYSPYFYPNGQLIQNTDKIVMKPHVNSFIWRDTIRYSHAMNEQGHDIWYWTFFDLHGKKLADKLVGDHDGPDDRDSIPHPGYPNDIPTISYDKTDIQKLPQPVLAQRGQKIWDIGGAYWFADRAKFFQIPAFRKMLDATYSKLSDYIKSQPQIGGVESDYLKQYLDYMNSMDPGNKRYMGLKKELIQRSRRVQVR